MSGAHSTNLHDQFAAIPREVGDSVGHCLLADQFIENLIVLSFLPFQIHDLFNVLYYKRDAFID